MGVAVCRYEPRHHLRNAVTTQRRERDRNAVGPVVIALGARYVDTLRFGWIDSEIVGQREEILDLESRRELSITIRSDSSLMPWESKTRCEK